MSVARRVVVEKEVVVEAEVMEEKEDGTEVMEEKTFAISLFVYGLSLGMGEATFFSID